MEETLKQQLDEFCMNIQSPERMPRQKAAKDCLEFCSSAKLTRENAAEIFDIIYLHIFRCYADRFEMIRSLSCSIISEMLQKLPANDFYLGYIVPVLNKRIGQPETIEESEEMRLQLVQQLHQIVEKYHQKHQNQDKLLKSYDDIINILLKTVKDPYPAVQKKCCELVITLASATPSFHYRAETLAGPLALILKHRHSANRIAAIEALATVSLHILSNTEAITKIIVDISPLLMDAVPFVRRACGRAGCLMLMEVRDRYSLFHRLLPLVLNCLEDETNEVKEEILEKWTKAGELYYQENETELSKLKLLDPVPSNYPNKYKRPTLACRAIVQRSLRVVNLVLSEMEEWKEDVRLHSTKLMKQIVLHSEKKFSGLFFEAYPVLAKTCMDSNKDVAAEACEVAKLIGILVDYDSWIAHLTDDFKKNPSLGHLKSFSILYEFSNEEKLKDLKKITDLLADSGVCHNPNEIYQKHLLNFMEILIKDVENVKDNDEILRNLYTVILKVIAFSYDDMESSNKDFGFQLLEKMGDNVAKLHDMYLEKLIEGIEDIELVHSDTSEGIQLLCGVMSACGFQNSYFKTMKSTIESALKHAAPEGRIKLFSAMSIAMLRWKRTILVPANDQLPLLKGFLDDVIAPYLIWNAGKSAESVRAMATTCLCSISQGTADDVACVIVSSVGKQFEQLLEDNSVVTRMNALQALWKVGALPFETLKPLAFAIITRLDDPSSEVRVKAARCLGVLRLAENDPNGSRWDEVLNQLFSIMFLHLENPEIKLRATILDSLKQSSIHHSEQLKKSANEVGDECPYKKDIINILSSIN